MFENLFNKTNILLASIILALYIAFIVSRLLFSGKSKYEKDMDRILTSDKHKVKGRFE
ncbi:hypothetical protein HYU11_04185 [Candidatus Woesearchaeota archaeon]|nr:hypothetical protein [Candidatus Woesearchaeota archaeon]